MSIRVGLFLKLSSLNSGSYISSLADFTAFHGDNHLAQLLTQKADWSLLLNPSSINQNLKELRQIVQPYSWVGQVVIDGVTEEVFAFGSKKRCQEGCSSSVKSNGSLMMFTAVSSDVVLEIKMDSRIHFGYRIC